VVSAEKAEVSIKALVVRKEVLAAAKILEVVNMAEVVLIRADMVEALIRAGLVETEASTKSTIIVAVLIIISSQYIRVYLSRSVECGPLLQVCKVMFNFASQPESKFPYVNVYVV